VAAERGGVSTRRKTLDWIAAGSFFIGFLLVVASGESHPTVVVGGALIVGSLVFSILGWFFREKRQEPSSPPAPAAPEAERSFASAPADALQDQPSTATADEQPAPVATGASAEPNGLSTLQTIVAAIAIGVFFIGGFLAKVSGGSDPVGRVGIVMALGALAVILLGGWLWRRKKQEPSSPPDAAASEAERPTQSLAPSDAQAATPPTPAAAPPAPTTARSVESTPPDAVQDQPFAPAAGESWAAPEPPEPPQAPSLM
jgi:hypothetical protein